jgi:outer membrane protein TolC
VSIIELSLLEDARARRDALNAILSLYKALGGSWQSPSATK